jgi:hypothetical protein
MRPHPELVHVLTALRLRPSLSQKLDNSRIVRRVETGQDLRSRGRRSLYDIRFQSDSLAREDSRWWRLLLLPVSWYQGGTEGYIGAEMSPAEA